jgi:N-acylneuraminate cytidylyltransferase
MDSNQKTKSIAIIPARGGSKRIPRKNIKNFCNRPIISYSIQAALESEIFDEVMVSTDDYEIAEIARQYGAKVPFMRSAEMSTDMAMTAPVLSEVINEYLKMGERFEYLCCIYPTAPFINSERLQSAMRLLIYENVESVMPIVKFSYPPQRCLVIRDDKVRMLHPENYNVRSQDLEPLYHDCGQFYCVKTSCLLEQQKLFCNKTIPIILSEVEVQDIDNEDDWVLAEVKYSLLHKG